jgi:hypothetical protein
LKGGEMSYVGYDKWTAEGKEISYDAYTIKELKGRIIANIKAIVITKARTDIDIEEYEVTGATVVIRKKK